MKTYNDIVNKLFHIIHVNFLAIILTCYFVAMIYPQSGVAMRDIDLGSVNLPQNLIFKFTLPGLMLSFLLFNAGLGVDLKRLLETFKSPVKLFLSIFLKTAISILIVFLLSLFLKTWHNQNEAQNILIGLIVMVAMPIANSTPTWVQNLDGNISLSLGLVIISTLLSPFITPNMIGLSSYSVTGLFKNDLSTLVDWNTSIFLIISVIIPSLIGIIMQIIVSHNLYTKIRPSLKLINVVVLSLLIYSNASISLPQIINDPDPDYHILVILLTLVLCILMFLAGWWISSLLKFNSDDRISMVFASGMLNNGAALILLSKALPGYPEALLPLIFYNLFQQILASIVTMMSPEKN